MSLEVDLRMDLTAEEHFRDKTTQEQALQPKSKQTQRPGTQMQRHWEQNSTELGGEQHVDSGPESNAFLRGRSAVGPFRTCL